MFNGFTEEDEMRLRNLDPNGFNFLMGGHLSQRNFKESLRAFACDELNTSTDKSFANYGGKTEMAASYPMLFKLSSDNGNVSYAGVLEFIAEEGRVYLPRWMMACLQVGSGDILEIQTASMPVGKFVKIKPQSPDFLDITDPKAVLENSFRNFTCLTKGDIISINYNEALYDFLVEEIKPEGEAISIVDTDLEVDFSPPVGYVEPTRPSSTASSLPSTTKIEALEKAIPTDNSFTAFSGSGNRIKVNNRRKKNDDDTKGLEVENKSLPIAPLNLPFGNLFFGYRIVPDPNAPVDPSQEDGEGKDGQDNQGGSSFSGAGNKLR